MFSQLFKSYQPSDELRCLNLANASPKVVQLDDLISRLAKNWRPTGYYLVTDIEKMLAVFATEAEAAGKALSQAPNSTSDAESAKRQAFVDVIRRYRDRSYAYERAVAQAKSEGTRIIDAPSFRDWVIGSLRSLSDMYVTAAVLHCNFSTIERVLDTAYRGMAKIGEIAYGIGSAAYDAAKETVKKVGNFWDDFWDFLGSVKRALPYIGLGAAALGVVGAGFYLNKKLQSGAGSEGVSGRMDQTRRALSGRGRITRSGRRR